MAKRPHHLAQVALHQRDVAGGDVAGRRESPRHHIHPQLLVFAVRRRLDRPAWVGWQRTGDGAVENACELVLESLQHVAARGQPCRQAGNRERTQLDLRRDAALVVEIVDGVEVLVGDLGAKAEAQHFVQRRTGCGTNRDAAAGRDLTPAARLSSPCSKRAEANLGEVYPARKRQRRVKRLTHATAEHRDRGSTRAPRSR
jgi:hypothetical protein